MDRKINEPNLRMEVITVLIVGILGSLGFIYVGQLALEATELDEMNFVVLGEAITPLLGAFVLWVGYALAFHIIARHYRSRDPIRRLFKGVAWGLTPIGVGNLVQSIAMYLAFQDIDVSDEMVGDGPQEQMQALLEAGMSEPAFIVATVIALLTVLWSGYLMSFAVEEGKSLSRDQALRVVAIPVAIHALYVIRELLRLVGVLG